MQTIDSHQSDIPTLPRAPPPPRSRHPATPPFRRWYIRFNVRHIFDNRKEHSQAQRNQPERQRTVRRSQNRRTEVNPEPAALHVDLDLAADDSADTEREAHASVQVPVDLTQGVRSEDGYPDLQRCTDGERGDVDVSRELCYGGLWLASKLNSRKSIRRCLR